MRSGEASQRTSVAYDNPIHTGETMSEKTLEQAATDISILLAQIDYFVDDCEQELCEEDLALVKQIRETWK